MILQPFQLFQPSIMIPNNFIQIQINVSEPATLPSFTFHETCVTYLRLALQQAIMFQQ
jgi:hypothetical protein